MLEMYMITQEVTKTTKQVKFLTYHLPRCKREEDKIKLIAMIAVKKIHIFKLSNLFIDNSKELYDEIF